MENRILMFDEHSEILTVKSENEVQLEKKAVLDIWESLNNQKQECEKKLNDINNGLKDIQDLKITKEIEKLNSMLKIIKKLNQKENLDYQLKIESQNINSINQQISELEPFVKKFR